MLRVTRKSGKVLVVMARESLDPLVFGHRLRHYRRQAGMTLEDLGRSLGRPASYLSQLENGHREPRLSTVNQLAGALGCRPADLLAPTAPNRRSELEVAIAHMQDDPRYQALHLPYLRPSARMDDAALEHVLLLRQIRRALESKSDHTIPEDFFLDMLDEQFSEEECLRQMETAVAWGRYAELFDFDAGRRRFVLPDAQEEEVSASEEAE